MNCNTLNPDVTHQWHPFTYVIPWLFLSSMALGQNSTEPVVPRPRAHAHNDYYHKRPLLDALSHGFCSVEADVYLIDGKLLVAHSKLELRRDKTLQKLYLDPLLERVRANTKSGQKEGRVFANGPTFTLLIDFKVNGGEIYSKLQQVLPRYREMLTRVENGKHYPGAVTIVISGDRPRAQIAASKLRYVGIDGRLSDLSSAEPAHLLPLISDRWTSHFKWRGVGPMPADEKSKLKTLVDQSHARNRRVRFWATPENPAIWKELHSAGVDLINTDKLAELEDFLARQ